MITYNHWLLLAYKIQWMCSDGDIACNELPTPLVAAVREMDDWGLSEITTRWPAIDTCWIENALASYFVQEISILKKLLEDGLDL